MKTKRTLFLLLSLLSLLSLMPVFGIDSSFVVAQRNQPARPLINPARPRIKTDPARKKPVVSRQSRSSDRVWQRIDKNKISTRLSDTQTLSPTLTNDSEMFTLNPVAIERILRRAEAVAARPAIKGRRNQVVLQVPLPDATYKQFAIRESSIMAPELAARFPKYKSYAGQGVRDKSATLRLSYTPFGMSAIVLSAEGATYINALGKGDDRTYVVYSKENLRQDESQFRCSVAEDKRARPDANLASGNNRSFSWGGTLRTFRLAVAATGEYTQLRGKNFNTESEKIDAAYDAIYKTIDSVNIIYQQELGIRLELVAKERDLIYADPVADPYSDRVNFPSDFDYLEKLMDENQNKIDAVVGPLNYDIGHVFGIEGGGLASPGTVCKDAWKAKGATGKDDPDPYTFDIEYVAHEIGHQFGANHTFNEITSYCKYRNDSTAFEPGGGTTIMGYGDICDPSVHTHTYKDNYFHVISLMEITDYVAQISGCPVSTPRNNLPPAVVAGPDRVIPIDTLFTLTATGSDPDNDKISYCWEQFDTCGCADPNTDVDRRHSPIYRSRRPDQSQSRTFPRLEDVLFNQPSRGEEFVKVDRVMNFRVTARDEWGNFSYDTLKVTFANNGSPFVVKEPNPPATWVAGTSQTITWDVANTNQSPINCLAVRISLSTDGGLTFPKILKDGARNDGSETVVVPNLETRIARIKVEAVGNVFFDISNNDFEIKSRHANSRALRRPVNLAFRRARPAAIKPVARPVS
jgi:hypothetical protein